MVMEETNHVLKNVLGEFIEPFAENNEAQPHKSGDETATPED